MLSDKREFKLGNTAIANINHVIDAYNKDNEYHQVVLNQGTELRYLLSMHKAARELFGISSASAFIIDMYSCLEAYIIGDSSGIFQRHYENKEQYMDPERITINLPDVRERMFSFISMATFLNNMETAFISLQREMEHIEK